MSSAHFAWLSTRVDRQADDLHVALVELGLELGDVAELGGADRREVLRVGEQHAPAVAEPLVEVDLALGGLGGEVGGGVAEANGHGSSLLHRWQEAVGRRGNTTEYPTIPVKIRNAATGHGTLTCD